MIISAKLIKKPRRARICATCGTGIFLSQVRLYGMAEKGDMPYTLYIHPECTTKEIDLKLELNNANN